MNWNGISSSEMRRTVSVMLALWLCLSGGLEAASAVDLLKIQAAGFVLATNDAVSTGTNQIALSLVPGSAQPFCQSAVKQGTAPAFQGPDPKIPYFTVRFALPIPPENATSNVALLTGIDPGVFTHNHSPGFEILPNGDALAVWFSTPPGESESATTTTFIQARLRYGAEQWDMPELYFDVQKYNDQSGLLWRDGNKIRFFGGGRGFPAEIPFKMAVSTDNGATWTLSLPLLDGPAAEFTAQPITSAFRAPDGSIYFAMDGHGSTSFLWRSADDGVRWQQMNGRTGGRHSVIVPLDGQGDLLSIGGKNSNVDGWSPENLSTNWGASWSKSKPSPFPPLGSAQRPSMIRLADGDLFFVSDAWLQKADKAPPEGWKYGNGCFVAVSTNNGDSWHVKSLPVQLPNHQFRKFGTVGYVVARQAANGVIHILTTETQPCLHYEMNEAWIFSASGDLAPEHSGGVLKHYSESYPNGNLRSQWSARICPHGRYLLDGLETDYYANGRREHVVTYDDGLKTGPETFWASDGTKLWSWEHNLRRHMSVWIHYWPNGRKKNESTWDTDPEARDLDRSFFGFVANGPFYQWNENGSPANAGTFTNGIYAGSRPLPPPQS